MARRRKIRYPKLALWMSDNCITYQRLSEMVGMQYHELWGKLNFQRSVTEEDIEALCKATGLSKKKLLEGEIIV